MLLHAAIEILVIPVHHILEERHQQHQIRRQPRRRIGGAQGVEGQLRGLGADHAAGQQGREGQADGHTGDQLGCSGPQHEGGSLDALHAVADHEQEAQQQALAAQQAQQAAPLAQAAKNLTDAANDGNPALREWMGMET